MLVFICHWLNNDLPNIKAQCAKTTFVLDCQSSNQPNSSKFSVVFLDPRDNAEFVTDIHIHCNPPVSSVTLPPTTSNFPPSTHYSTALIKFHHN
jgi:hypothetical protein